MKKRILLAVVAAVTTMGLVFAPVASAAPYCGIRWGSLPKTTADTSNSSLTNVRTGRHACFDRMVFDMNGSASGYNVRYVSNVYTDGAGKLVPLSGGAKLRVIVHAPSYNPNNYAVTYKATVGKTLPGVNLKGYKTFRSAKFAGSFEGQSTVGLGVRAKLPFRVFKIDNRVVIDVAHKW